MLMREMAISEPSQRVGVEILSRANQLNVWMCSSTFDFFLTGWVLLELAASLDDGNETSNGYHNNPKMHQLSKHETRRTEATHRYPQTKTPLIWILRIVLICSFQSIGRGITSMMTSIMRLPKPLPIQRVPVLRHLPGSETSHAFWIGLHMKVTLNKIPTSHPTFMACTAHRAYLNLELLTEKMRA